MVDKLVSNKTPRIPLSSNGIQYNFCKNPSCNNFGIEAEQELNRGAPGRYVVVGGGKDFPLLKCSCCGETHQ